MSHAKRKREPAAAGSDVLCYRGARDFRARLTLAVLSGKTVKISEIRAGDDDAPGLAPHEASFVRLLDKLTNGSRIAISTTGVAVRFAPGVLTGGRVEHECGGGRSCGWFLEGVLPLAMWGKAPLTLELRGVTHDDRDASPDLLRLGALPVLWRFGVGEARDDGARLSIEVQTRGSAPGGGGACVLRCPAVRELSSIDAVDPGLVKKVRGLAYCHRAAAATASRLATAARGPLNKLLPDVRLAADAAPRRDAGASPGFGVALAAHTTTNCRLTVERATDGTARGDGERGDGDGRGRPELPEDLGKAAGELLLEEVARGGCVPTGAQPLALTLMALTPEDASRLRVGRLSEPAVATLRLLKDFLGVEFHLELDAETRTTLLVCLGSGYRNSSLRVT